MNDLIAALRPSLVVELGTHFGESYFGICQAVQENGVSCKCYAVDTWQGDPHYNESVFTEVNAYNQRHYRLFSTLLRTTFDDAKENFGDGTVDLLHIDGVRTYDAIRHDFENWFPKVRPGGVVLLHDTAARHEDFQVWKLWEELARQYPHLEFHHSGGLGVLQKPGAAGGSGESVHAVLSTSTSNQDFVRHYYAVQADLLERRRHTESFGGSELDAAVAERDAALMRQESLSAEVRNLQAERVAVVADNRRTHGINDSLANEIASLKSSLAASQARIGRLEDETAALLQQRLAIEGELKLHTDEEQRLGQENVRLAKELNVVYQSRSWWLTAPLRRLFRAIR